MSCVSMLELSVGGWLRRNTLQNHATGDNASRREGIFSLYQPKHKFILLRNHNGMMEWSFSEVVTYEGLKS